MSQLKTYEAATIEEALRAVTLDLGEDVEILEAVKERRGGMFGFFAHECFVVKARSKNGAVEREPEEAFGDMLLELANGVADTWEPATDGGPQEPVLTSPGPQDATAARDSLPTGSQQWASPVPTAVAPTAPPVGLIDLRTGKRRPAPMVPLVRAADDSRLDPERPVRPSHLRRRLLGDGVDGPREQYVMEVDGPMIDLRDSVPRWSLARLQMLNLPDSLLEAIEVLEPTRDLEWVQSLALAISRLKPEDPDAALTYVIGHGRRSAPELVRGIPHGRIPAALIIEGVRVKVTPEELALSIRACLR